MLMMVHDHITTGMTRATVMTVVLRCGKLMEKLPHYYFSWAVSAKNRDKCKMPPLETKQYRGKLLPPLDLQKVGEMGCFYRKQNNLLIL
jgi:hypothetical protein